LIYFSSPFSVERSEDPGRQSKIGEHFQTLPLEALLRRRIMKILIKTLKGESFPLEVEGTETILSIKSRAEAVRADLPAARQKLIHAGKVLKDEDIISSTNVKEGEFLVCMVSKEAKVNRDRPAGARGHAFTEEPIHL
jgi:hypothetical protein